MRARGGPSSELLHLAAPLAAAVDALWSRMHWWIVIMGLLYAASGTTIVRADEVAVVLRWGRLVGDTPAQQEHGPGLLFSFPRPVDRVVRVPVKRVWEITVQRLSDAGPVSEYPAATLDPVSVGYAVTGDHNIVQAEVVARYRVRSPAEWAFYGPKAEELIPVEVAAAMSRSLGEAAVDRVLADGRTDVVSTARARTQAGLDAAHSGLELTSLELTRLAPAPALAADFNAVQSAYIAAESQRKDAHTFAERVVPQAQGAADAGLQSARGAADIDQASARGEAAAFVALDREYRSNPGVVRERLYRDAVERAIGVAGSVMWVPPPPAGARYQGFRIRVPSITQPPSTTAAEDDEP